MLTDDFDYPMPKRETNWTLRGEEQARSKQRAAAAKTTNRTDDIEGAASGTTALYRTRQYMHKPNLFNVSDIGGASPQRQIPADVAKPNDRILRNNDIDHSFPESKLFSTPRIVDLMCPQYKLPAVRYRPPTPQEPKRDTLKISDIEGTRPKPHWVRSSVTNPLDYSDIPFSTAGSHGDLQKRKSPSMNLTTKDINEVRKPLHRTVNPLNPEYELTLPNATKITIGEIPKSKPREPAPQRQDRPLMSLRSADIEGCQSGNNVPYPKERRGWKTTNDVSDIGTKGRRTLH